MQVEKVAYFDSGDLGPLFRNICMLAQIKMIFSVEFLETLCHDHRRVHEEDEAVCREQSQSQNVDHMIMVHHFAFALPVPSSHTMASP
jgi:hypothetical protein